MMINQGVKIKRFLNVLCQLIMCSLISFGLIIRKLKDGLKMKWRKLK